MPSYKLIYFNMMGRAEPSRYLFELAGVKYEDKRVSSDEWGKLKPEIPHGKLPVLEADGKLLIQSHAIHHYLADVLGFMPKDAWGRAQVEVICETDRELSAPVAAIFNEEDESKKAELKSKLGEETVPKVIDNLEKALKANNDGKSWFVGDKVTLADVMVFNLFYDFIPTLLDKKQDYKPSDHPLFSMFLERFHDLPQIKKWIETRPVTSM